MKRFIVKSGKRCFSINIKFNMFRYFDTTEEEEEGGEGGGGAGGGGEGGTGGGEDSLI